MTRLCRLFVNNKKKSVNKGNEYRDTSNVASSRTRFLRTACVLYLSLSLSLSLSCLMSSSHRSVCTKLKSAVGSNRCLDLVWSIVSSREFAKPRAAIGRDNPTKATHAHRNSSGHLVHKRRFSGSAGRARDRHTHLLRPPFRFPDGSPPSVPSGYEAVACAFLPMAPSLFSALSLSSSIPAIAFSSAALRRARHARSRIYCEIISVAMRIPRVAISLITPVCSFVRSLVVLPFAPETAGRARINIALRTWHTIDSCRWCDRE